MIETLKNGEHYSKELESMVLGVCMMEASGFSRIYGTLHEKHFYFQDNQTLFRVLRKRHEKALPTNDVVLVQYDYMKEQLLFTHRDDPHYSGRVLSYLVAMTNTVSSGAHLEHHAGIIIDMWRTRELLIVTKSGFNPDITLSQQAYDIQTKMNELLSYGTEKEWHSMDELVFNLFVHQDKIKRGDYQFVTTGFPTLDKENGGFAGGNMIVLGARPSVGKSALMIKMAIAAARSGKKVGIISLEMNNNEIAARLVSQDTQISFSTVYRNLFEDEMEHQRFYQYVSKNTINLPIWVSDKSKTNIGEIKAKAYKLKAAHGLDELWLDYLQLVESVDDKNRNRTREQEVSALSRGIKLMAKEMDIPVIALCQLNRATTSRTGQARYPRMSDLRESGALEQDADIVMMLHRDYLAGIDVNENGFSTENEADLLVEKWRNGAPVRLPLHFDPNRMLFKERGMMAVAYRAPETPFNNEPLRDDDPF